MTDPGVFYTLSKPLPEKSFLLPSLHLPLIFFLIKLFLLGKEKVWREIPSAVSLSLQPRQGISFVLLA